MQQVRGGVDDGDVHGGGNGVGVGFGGEGAGARGGEGEGRDRARGGGRRGAWWGLFGGKRSCEGLVVWEIGVFVVVALIRRAWNAARGGVFFEEFGGAVDVSEGLRRGAGML